jgi:hypothetical protein
MMYMTYVVLSGVWKYCNFELFDTVLNLFCLVAHKNIVLIPQGTLESCGCVSMFMLSLYSFVLAIYTVHFAICNSVQLLSNILAVKEGNRNEAAAVKS